MTWLVLIELSEPLVSDDVVSIQVTQQVNFSLFSVLCSLFYSPNIKKEIKKTKEQEKKKTKLLSHLHRERNLFGYLKPGEFC